jgi:hypothetical protein
MLPLCPKVHSLSDMIIDNPAADAEVSPTVEGLEVEPFVQFPP